MNMRSEKVLCWQISIQNKIYRIKLHDPIKHVSKDKKPNAHLNKKAKKKSKMQIQSFQAIVSEINRARATVSQLNSSILRGEFTSNNPMTYHCFFTSLIPSIMFSDDNMTTINFYANVVSTYIKILPLTWDDEKEVMNSI